MIIKESYVVKIPEWALPTLINGDTSGLSREDFETIKSWSDSWDSVFDLSVLSGESYFSSSPEFGLPCNVYDCTVDIYERAADNGGTTNQESARAA